MGLAGIGGTRFQMATEGGSSALVHADLKIHLRLSPAYLGNIRAGIAEQLNRSLLRHMPISSAHTRGTFQQMLGFGALHSLARALACTRTYNTVFLLVYPITTTSSFPPSSGRQYVPACPNQTLRYRGNFCF